MQRLLACALVGLTVLVQRSAPATEPDPALAIPRSKNVSPAMLAELEVVKGSTSVDFTRKTRIRVEARQRAEPEIDTGSERSLVLNRQSLVEIQRQCARPKGMDLATDCRTSQKLWIQDQFKIVGENTVEVVGDDTKPVSIPVPAGSPSEVPKLGVGPRSEVVRPTVFGPGAISVVPAPAKRRADLYTDVVAVGLKGSWRCTGVLVSENAVLTAAHCLPADSVAFGYDLAKAREEFAVEAVDLAPSGLDAALLQLSKDTGRNPRPWRLSSDTAGPSGSMTIVGFGTNDIRGTTGFGVMRKNAIETQGWGCDVWRVGALGCDPRAEMVLQSSAGRDTCRGDSGGPVFEAVGNETRLVAITSRPIPTPGQPCGRGGIYVRLDAISDWILARVTTTAKKGTGQE